MGNAKNHWKNKNWIKTSSPVYVSITIMVLVFLYFICSWTIFTNTKTISIPGEGIYTGHVKNGYFNGTGTWQSENGVTYIGEFKDGMYDGQGTMVFANGATYTGGFNKGFMHGHGVMEFPNGRIHEGEWDASQLIAEEETHSHDHDH